MKNLLFIHFDVHAKAMSKEVPEDLLHKLSSFLEIESQDILALGFQNCKLHLTLHKAGMTSDFCDIESPLKLGGKPNMTLWIH